jgi:starvation-inducible DNA-binding protein
MGQNRNNGQNSKLRILIQPNIGLDSESRQSVVGILNTFLADEAVLMLKTHKAQWHARGPGFLDLKVLFDQQYHQLNTISNEIAERVHILGGLAIGSFAEFLHTTRLKERPGEASQLVDLLADHEASIRFLREDARKCFEEYEDQVTFTLFVGFIQIHEKIAWILRSYIEPEPAADESPSTRLRPAVP